MKILRKTALTATGFSLIENLFAVSIISLTMPLIFGALTVCIAQKQKASQDHRVDQIVDHIFGEIPYAWLSANSVLFPSSEPLVFPQLSQESDLAILYAPSAQLYTSPHYSQISSSDWEINNPENAQKQSIEASSGYMVTISNPTTTHYSENLTKVDLKIGYPAGKPESARTHYYYSRLFRRP